MFFSNLSTKGLYCAVFTMGLSIPSLVRIENISRNCLNRSIIICILFNTSGVQYRELKIKDKIKTMTENQAVDLLASNGRLVKRPIAVDKNKITVGFDIEEYKKVW